MCETRRLDADCLVEVVREGSLDAMPRPWGKLLLHSRTPVCVLKLLCYQHVRNVWPIKVCRKCAEKSTCTLFASSQRSSVSHKHKKVGIICSRAARQSVATPQYVGRDHQNSLFLPSPGPKAPAPQTPTRPQKPIRHPRTSPAAPCPRRVRSMPFVAFVVVSPSLYMMP